MAGASLVPMDDSTIAISASLTPLVTARLSTRNAWVLHQLVGDLLEAREPVAEWAFEHRRAFHLLAEQRHELLFGEDRNTKRGCCAKLRARIFADDQQLCFLRDAARDGAARGGEDALDVFARELHELARDDDRLPRERGNALGRG